MASIDGDLAETIGIGNIGFPVKATLGAAADTVDVATALTGLVGLQLFEVIAVTQGEQVNGTYHSLIAEAGRLQDKILGAYTRTVADTIELDAAIILGRAVRVIEGLSLVDALLPGVRYHRTLAEAVTISAEIARFFGASAADGLVMAEVAQGDAYKGAHVDEAAQITAVVSPRFVLRVDALDEITIDAAELVRMAFNGSLADTIEISAAYLESGSITTWAMNTRSAAVTQYENYDFNSFARFGHKHLGASENGLYELIGDTDDGDDIIATIRSGFTQWAGAHLHAFKAVYLAVRGSGDFVLRIITGDGKIYNYAATAESILTTKIHTGKGLRSRYFAFELVSTGQDFDLETLEFVPLVAKRRV